MSKWHVIVEEVETTNLEFVVEAVDKEEAADKALRLAELERSSETSELDVVDIYRGGEDEFVDA